MKEIKLSFPYPSTSRHNLSQDVATSLSMGLVTPIRVVEVLPGDSHRIGTSFSLVSNPLVKPLLQGVRMRYCRFWVPRRIYHLAMRANNSNYDPRTQGVRFGVTDTLYVPYSADATSEFASNFGASSLFDYLRLSPMETGLSAGTLTTFPDPPATPRQYRQFRFNAEPYLGYIDICRNYFADSANDMIAFMSHRSGQSQVKAVVTTLSSVDSYIDRVQQTNSSSAVVPYFISDGYVVDDSDPLNVASPTSYSNSAFSHFYFGQPYFGLCVPLVRPDRLSRMFTTAPLTSQNATISSAEITIGNLSFLSKLQRYLTRRFFGGSRYTDVMYSIFGQKVPHVDSPVCLDVFDTEIGSELVSSTNADSSNNPGVLGGYFSSSGVLRTGRGSSRKRYTFNEAGYIIDLCYIMPRLFRSQFYPDFYPVGGSASAQQGSPMQQGVFLPDFNGIGWQQPAFNSINFSLTDFSSGSTLVTASGFSSEPSWQQYRTLPDVVSGVLNPSNGGPYADQTVALRTVIGSERDLNSPVFVFTDHFSGDTISRIASPFNRLARQLFFDPASFNIVFGQYGLNYDNIFVVFRYSHQSKRQVTKRFTLSFN